jgi:hypothetical protein
MYTQEQFRQHMDNVRRYSYLQGQNKKLAWLYEKYTEQRLTESMERQFVYDVDMNLEELANGLQNEDFMVVMNYWTELSMKYWNTEQRRAFMKKLDSLRKDYRRLGEALGNCRNAVILEKRWQPKFGIMLVWVVWTLFNLAMGIPILKSGKVDIWVLLILAFGGLGVVGIIVCMFNHDTSYTCSVCGHRERSSFVKCPKCGMAIT